VSRPAVLGPTFVRAGSELAGAAGMLAVAVVVARALGPAARGQLAVVTTIGVIAFMLGNLGIGSATIYFAAGRRVPHAVLLGNALVAGLALGVATALVAGGAVLAAPWLVAGAPGWAVSAPLLLMPVAFLELYLSFLILGRQRLVAGSLLGLAARLASVLVVVAVVALRPGVVPAAFALQSAPVIRLALNLVYMGRTGLLERPRCDLASLRATIGFGLRGRGHELFQYLNLRFDALLVNAYLSPAAVGVYTLAAMTIEFAWLPSAAFAWVLFPRSAARAADRSSAGREAIHARRIVWLTAALAIAIAFAGVPLVPLVFGAEFGGARACLLLLLPGAVAYPLSIVLSAALAGRGLPSHGSLIAAAGFALTVALDLLLIPPFGIRGAAIASSLAYLAASLVAVALYRRATGVPVSDLLIPRRADLAALTAGASVVSRRLGALLPRPQPGAQR
jgi:O-antigen/teichoic acid export membrane protein